MALPLMPGTEVFQSEPAPDWFGGTVVIQGCTCSICVGAQPVRNNGENIPKGPVGYQRGRYDHSRCTGDAVKLTGEVRWRIPGTLDVCDASGRSQWDFDEALPDGTLVQTRGLNTGARWVPDTAVSTVVNGRIRGRYTLDAVANASLAGLERWLDPTTGMLYDDATDGLSSNSGMLERTDRTWRSRGDMIWEAI